MKTKSTFKGLRRKESWNYQQEFDNVLKGNIALRITVRQRTDPLQLVNKTTSPERSTVLLLK